MCKNSCNECCRKVFSQSVTVVTNNGVDTLVIDVGDISFRNNYKGCFVIIQNIPDTVTINMPVAISINGDTTTLYPVTNCSCAQVTACSIRTRRRYPFIVKTTPTGAVFRVLKNLSCAPNNNLNSIPVTTTVTIGG